MVFAFQRSFSVTVSLPDMFNKCQLFGIFISCQDLPKQELLGDHPGRSCML